MAQTQDSSALRRGSPMQARHACSLRSLRAPLCHVRQSLSWSDGLASAALLLFCSHAAPCIIVLRCATSFSRRRANFVDKMVLSARCRQYGLIAAPRLGDHPPPSVPRSLPSPLPRWPADGVGQGRRSRDRSHAQAPSGGEHGEDPPLARRRRPAQPRGRRTGPEGRTVPFLGGTGAVSALARQPRQQGLPRV